ATARGAPARRLSSAEAPSNQTTATPVDSHQCGAKLSIVRPAFFLLTVLFACGGRVGATDGGDDSDGAPEGGRFPRLPDGAPFVDPTCPDSGPPPVDNKCDVLDPLKNCPSGTACYPVTYPPMEKCE